MRIILIVILAFLLFEPQPNACSFLARRVPENAYPENVGKFKREYVLHEGKFEISSKYFDPNRPNLHSISMDLGLGDLLDSSLAKCSAENLANNIFDVKSLKNSDLKDKSGKKVGNIRICQDNEQEAENFYIEMTNGEVSFFIRTNNLKGETEKNEPLKFNEIVEFVREIPFNTNVIFENLP